MKLNLLDVREMSAQEMKNQNGGDGGLTFMVGANVFIAVIGGITVGVQKKSSTTKGYKKGDLGIKIRF